MNTPIPFPLTPEEQEYGRINPFILVFGLPGSGKTTASTKLEQRLKEYGRLYSRYNTDEVARSAGTQKYHASTMTKCRRSIRNVIEHELRLYRGIILDRVALSLDTRHYYYDLASRCGGIPVISVYCTCSEQTALERVRRRPEDDGLHVPGRDARVYFKYKRAWEKDNPEFAPFDKGFDEVGYSADVHLRVNRHVAVLRYDTESNQVTIMEKFLTSPIRKWAERVKEILLEGTSLTLDSERKAEF